MTNFQRRTNNLLVTVFLTGVAIALLNYLGAIDWILGLNTAIKVLIGIGGFVVVVLLIKYRKAR